MKTEVPTIQAAPAGQEAGGQHLLSFHHRHKVAAFPAPVALASMEMCPRWSLIASYDTPTALGHITAGTTPASNLSKLAENN